MTDDNFAKGLVDDIGDTTGKLFDFRSSEDVATVLKNAIEELEEAQALDQYSGPAQVVMMLNQPAGVVMLVGTRYKGTKDIETLPLPLGAAIGLYEGLASALQEYSNLSGVEIRETEDSPILFAPKPDSR